jgi:hypothetical protein
LDAANEHANERRVVTQMQTTPSSNGEAPLPRRTPRGLLPSTWTGHTVKVEYTGADGLSATTSGALLELLPFGPILKSSQGDKFALSWDRISMIELQED